MEWLFLAGFVSAAFIGIALGMIGGGGSILTLPVLVYMMGVEPVLATAYSLFVVGTTALFGAFSYWKKQLVNVRVAFLFGLPSFVAVFLTRKFVMPAIPEVLFTIGNTEVSRDTGIMVLFALLMLAAAISMIRPRKNPGAAEPHLGQPLKYQWILMEGFVVGFITGLVGAGGGFLIIPALVLFAGLPMTMAVGTSLLIIAAKSLIGFVGDIGQQPIDWTFLGIFSSIAVVGIFIGAHLAKKVSPDSLKTAFGWFVLIMGLYISGRELLF